MFGCFNFRKKCGMEVIKVDRLSELQIKFCENWMKNGGNGMRAAIDAGYKPAGAGVQATRLLKTPKIQEYIRNRRRGGNVDALIAETNDILKFWTAVMQGNADELDVDFVPLAERIKASENLAKTSGMFSEKVILQNANDSSFNVSFTVVDGKDSG